MSEQCLLSLGLHFPVIAPCLDEEVGRPWETTPADVQLYLGDPHMKSGEQPEGLSLEKQSQSHRTGLRQNRIQILVHFSVPWFPSRKMGCSPHLTETLVGPAQCS